MEVAVCCSGLIQDYTAHLLSDHCGLLTDLCYCCVKVWCKLYHLIVDVAVKQLGSRLLKSAYAETAVLAEVVVDGSSAMYTSI